MDIQLESVFSMFYQPDECISGFSYSSHEMIYFCNGCGRVRINKTDYKYEKNSVLLMKNTDIKDYVAESYTEYICIRFKCYNPESTLWVMISCIDYFCVSWKNILIKNYDIMICVM